MTLVAEREVKIIRTPVTLPENRGNFSNQTSEPVRIINNAELSYHFNTRNCRWDVISGEERGFRLLCTQESCSLSNANVRNGFLSVTSIHGSARHSHILSEKDRTFLILEMLDTLSASDLRIVCNKLLNLLDYY